jgi:hypothetical protein
MSMYVVLQTSPESLDPQSRFVQQIELEVIHADGMEQVWEGNDAQFKPVRSTGHFFNHQI